MGTLIAIVKAITAAFGVFKQERELYNKPELVKAKASEKSQELKDKISKLDAVLADPNATSEQHKKALDEVRLLQS